MSEAAWCVECGARFSEAEIEGKSACPKCGSTGIPCYPENDFLIEINSHELTILCLWAERWAETFKGDAVRSRKSLAGIVGRLQRQLPGVPPLTLSGQIADLRKAPNIGKVETNLPDTPMLAIVNGPGAVGHARKPSTQAEKGEDHV